eukprot:352942-Chlamydomonas_euryale.AAC.1
MRFPAPSPRLPCRSYRPKTSTPSYQNASRPAPAASRAARRTCTRRRSSLSATRCVISASLSVCHVRVLRLSSCARARVSGLIMEPRFCACRRGEGRTVGWKVRAVAAKGAHSRHGQRRMWLDYIPLARSKKGEGALEVQRGEEAAVQIGEEAAVGLDRRRMGGPRAAAHRKGVSGSKTGCPQPRRSIRRQQLSACYACKKV